MTPSPAPHWHERNKDLLDAELAVIACLLRRCPGARAEVEPAPGDDLERARERLRLLGRAMNSPSSLDHLTHAFGLSTFERQVLLLCAGVEMSSELAELCGQLHGDPRQSAPSFSLALTALEEAHWSALIPAAALRRWRLVHVEASTSGALTTAPLRVDERVLHFLMGVDYLPVELEGRVRPGPPSTYVMPEHAALLDRLSTLFQRSVNDPQAVHLHAWRPDAGSEVINAAARAAGRVPMWVQAASVPEQLDERRVLSRVWEREVALTAAQLCVMLEPGVAASQSLRTFLDDLDASVVILGDQPIVGLNRTIVRLECPPPSSASVLAQWSAYLPAMPQDWIEPVANAVARFELAPRDVQAVAGAVALPASVDALAEHLHDACRVQARPSLEGLALHVRSSATWDDLALPPRAEAVLRQMCEQLRHQHRVHERWGFRSQRSQGLGLTAMFAGPSGTGKTLAAEVIANALRLDLFRIDLSALVSKYIGETEKNLRRVFDEAESGSAVLLFDEADALFGSRSEVKDSHDRYANIEVGYLLQRMESYRGLAILTTNLKDNLDAAFLRRIRFVVDFSFPDAAQRATIWSRMFPALTPTEDLDFQRAAQLQVAGGNIRNIALNAAFLAAAEDAPVRMAHLRRAAMSELGKLGRAPSPSEFRGWT